MSFTVLATSTFARLSTVLIQVPQHRTLAIGHSGEAVRSLIAGNRIRTAAWTRRGALLAIVTTTTPT